jgi:SAM-dependent methyltransferase
MPADWTERGYQRRVSGLHDFRLDGIGDLLCRARDASVLDIGCNRGMAGMDFAHNGATLVHGCDNYRRGIEVANEVFADLRSVESRFEVVDLRGGEAAIRDAFAESYQQQYDFVLLLAIYHKLRRVMERDHLLGMMVNLANRCSRYIAWRGYAEEVAEFEPVLIEVGFRRAQYSEISETITPAGIWARVK